MRVSSKFMNQAFWSLIVVFKLEIQPFKMLHFVLLAQILYSNFWVSFMTDSVGVKSCKVEVIPLKVLLTPSRFGWLFLNLCVNHIYIYIYTSCSYSPVSFFSAYKIPQMRLIAKFVLNIGQIIMSNVGQGMFILS